MILERWNPVPDSDRQVKLNQIFSSEQEKIIDTDLLSEKFMPMLLTDSDFN